ncbi:MAG: LysR family transcriptional regulator, partial [Clostridia bacterium]|nr:LysR family transcriptional regulator [Clostridia bacterium]
MTIQQCKYVVEIAKRGSFHEASKRLFIAQSSLSNSIKLLEDELN